ncbi:MAG TPA: multiheme c-type cytochrome [Pirellulaceae bacterium]|nr:multiheme c-type cytochrome [Pirellulaceae bacterium]
MFTGHVQAKSRSGIGAILPLVYLSAALLAAFGIAWKLNRNSVNGFVKASIHPGNAAGTAQDDDQVRPTFPPASDLVKEWQKPDVTLLVSGSLTGYIEPCGCTGLENQKGGLMRRHSAQKKLLQRGWELISIDAGDHERRIGVQALVKLETTLETLCRIMQYDMVGIGPLELKVPAIDLVQRLENNKSLRQGAASDFNPFVSCNVAILDDSFTNKFQIVERGAVRVGMTTAIADEFLNDIKDSDISTIPLAQGVANVIPAMQRARCDFLVLVVHGSIEECEALARKFPVFDVMVMAGGAGDPTYQPELIAVGNHTTHLIQVGAKGMHVGLVGLYKQPQRRIVYERVPMDARFEDSEEVKVIFKRYQDRLKAMYLDPARYKFEDITPRKHPSGNTFVGSVACRECHEDEYDIWRRGIDGQGGPHFRATLDLTDPGERTWVQRHYDPECLSCHVTGWNPQQYYPYETGYMDEANRRLHGNGCENCHGPGSAHVAAEKGDVDATPEQMVKLQEAMRLTLEQARTRHCMECHDIDNSPDFFKDGAFEHYWEKIKH